MLPAAHRLRTSSEFSQVVRGGRRAGRPTLTVHGDAAGSDVPRAGLVVSKAVGSSVTRHAVSRKLRHQLASRIAGLPAGTRLVVRASPGSGDRDQR